MGQINGHRCLVLAGNQWTPVTGSVDTRDQITGHGCQPTSPLPLHELFIIGHLGDQLTNAREEKSAAAAPEQLQMEANATRHPVPHAT